MKPQKLSTKRIGQIAAHGFGDTVTGNKFDQLLSHIAALDEEIETHRMQLAACGVAAMCNTEKTASERIGRGNPYWSASYGDICRTVDREMALRADNEKLREGLRGFAAILESMGQEIQADRIDQLLGESSTSKVGG